MANGTPQKRAFQEVSISGGFNRTWGLPLVQAPVYSAGSVYVFQVADWNLEQVAALERDGIGERRNEGYGRVGVTALTIPQISCAKGSTLRREAGAALAPANRQMAQSMADRLLQQRLERLILTKAANYPIRTCPSGSQIARLRAVLLEQLLKPRGTMSVAPIVAFVNGLRSHAETQYRKARVQGSPLNEWIRRLCANATTSEFTDQTLGFNRRDGVTLGGVRSTLLTENGDLTNEAATECALKFLDAVLARAAKQED
jgi:CRISPR-associated protein Csx10